MFIAHAQIINTIFNQISLECTFASSKLLHAFVAKVRYSRVIAKVTIASQLLHRQRWLLDLESVDCTLMGAGQKKQALLE